MRGSEADLAARVPWYDPAVVRPGTHGIHGTHGTHGTHG